jgi:hypothetical protein
MAEARCGVGVDRDLSDLASRELVSSMHFERRSPDFRLESFSQRRRDERGCNFLVHFDDALAEQVLDQVEDRTTVALQALAFILLEHQKLGGARWQAKTRL